jgi:CheY-like chemotaxis protein
LSHIEQTSQVFGRIILVLFRNTWASYISETRTRQEISSLTVVTHTQANSDEEADMNETVFASKGDATGAAFDRRKHILCADDHEDTRAMMAILLDLSGYKVTTAGSVAEALPLTERGGFDLLLLDGLYADGFGVDLCKQIRAFDARTPIVFLSADAYQADIQKGLEAGAQAYLAKPFDFDALTQTIEQFIL